MIIRIALFLVIATISLSIPAQQTVVFNMKDATLRERDSVFITGTFNHWDSLASPDFKLSRGDEYWTITLQLAPGHYAYKYTGGNWHSVEKNWPNMERPNREITIQKDTIVYDRVEFWRDHNDLLLMLKKSVPDTAKVRLLNALAFLHVWSSEFYDPDTALYYFQETFQLLDKIKSDPELKNWDGYVPATIYTNRMFSYFNRAIANITRSLEIDLNNLRFVKNNQSDLFRIEILIDIVDDYINMRDYTNALTYCTEAERVLKESGYNADLNDRGWKWISISYAPILADITFFKSAVASQITINHRMALIYNGLNMADSAFARETELYSLAKNNSQLYASWNNRFYISWAGYLLGERYSAMNQPDSALQYYQLTGYALADALSQMGMAKLYLKQGAFDPAMDYALRSEKALETNRLSITTWGDNVNNYLGDLMFLIADLYANKGQHDSAYYFLRRSVNLKDSLYNADRIIQFQNLTFNEKLRQQEELQNERETRQKYEARLKLYVLLVGIAGLAIVAYILFRNNKHKQKANSILTDQKKRLENTLNELQATQQQLIHSEKMASLGALTAGIAHEIKNPLNFVNNFSDVNKELLIEMQQELEAGNLDAAKVIARDIAGNEEKINTHGARADAIVKSMLQHSRGSSGDKELTDINSLADEYLRLAYHGMRAKDKSFSGEIKTDFDTTLPKVNVVSQDIGRVLLNLINNAFYAVSERSHQESTIINQQSPADAGYRPLVTVTTRHVNGQVEITVGDNGNGIPQDIVDKIFQPFFTTKPTGEGTGLGLSLAYDIITKGHGGEMRVETEEGVGSTFYLHLPL